MNDTKRDGARRRRTPRGSTWPRDERGSVMATVALTLTALVALIALSVDIGALFNARAEAQRAADAAALAGASAFLEYQRSEAQQAAVAQAVEFSTSNEIRNEAITPEETSVWVNLDSATVRAAIRREGVPTWFARLVGVDAVDIGAQATAWAAEGGAAQCVKPFALPDLWEETSDDLNRNRIWDDDENWSYDPASGDRYAGFSGNGGGSSETGYGSGFRDGQVDVMGRRYAGDYGRRVTVKVTNPADAFVPSFFLPWALPSDAGQAECGSNLRGRDNGGGGRDGEGGGDVGDPGQGGGLGWLKWSEKRGDLGVSDGPGNGNGGPGGPGGPGGGGGDVETDGGAGKGAANYRRNICSCNNSIIDLDTEYLIEPGNMVGPTYQGVQTLIEQDPDAYWDERSNTVVSDHGLDSPRVVTVALFDPGEIRQPGRQHLRFNNFARIFIEEQESRQDAVTGRFLYYVPGLRGREGSTTGSLVRVLQLIR